MCGGLVCVLVGGCQKKGPDDVIVPADAGAQRTVGANALSGDEAKNFWEGVRAAHATRTRVEATLEGRGTGGYHLRLSGNFAPGRRIEKSVGAVLLSANSLDEFVGTRVMCTVTSFDEASGAILLKLDVEQERRRRETLSRLQAGATFDAHVEKVTPVGVVVTLDAIPKDLWLSTPVLHATELVGDGGLNEGDALRVTPQRAWTSSFDDALFFVTLAK